MVLFYQDALRAQIAVWYDDLKSLGISAHDTRYTTRQSQLANGSTRTLCASPSIRS